MTTEELSALLSDLDTARFTLEDALRIRPESPTSEGTRSAPGEDATRADAAGTWVAYLYEHRTNLTYRVADYAAYRHSYAYLPTAWIVHEPRTQRSGRDESMRAAALTHGEARQMLDRGDGVPCRVEAIHVRYDEHDDDRYTATVRLPDGTYRDVTAFATYEAQCQPTAGVSSGADDR